MKKINVGVVGVGSFTKALVEGVSFLYQKSYGNDGLDAPAYRAI